MKRLIYDPKFIIGIGLAMFIIASVDSMTVKNYNYTCWFRCLNADGQIAVVIFAICLVWLFVSTLIKKR